MQTECPHCHTIFHVKESELEQADGQVRCGHCLAIFTADNPYTSFTPQIDADELDFNDPADNIVADVVPPELRAETRQGKTRFGFIGTFFLTLAILASIAASILQYSYYNRNELVKITELRPWLKQFCDKAGCSLPLPKGRSLIILSSKNIFSHPNVNHALMVTASITNQADFPQDFPIIELRFENVRGQTIAARRFYPIEYLAIPQNQIARMQPDVPVNISLEIKDPGEDMVSYEFRFL